MERASNIAAAVLIASSLVAMAWFFAYPATIAGPTEDSLGASFNNELGGDHPSPEFWTRCWDGEEVDWRCGGYRVGVDWRGCWDAESIGGSEALSSCISFGDWLGLNGPLLAGGS